MRLSTLIRTRWEHVLNERRTRGQIEARQLKKFRRLVRHAARHSPYYQEIIERHGIDPDRCVPPDFPILTKTEAMENFDRIVTDRTVTRAKITDFLERSNDPFDLYEDRYYVVHTSGTSGEVGCFVYSPDDWSRGVAGALRVNPPSLGKRRLAFFGATQGHFTGATLAACVRQPAIRWAYDLELYEINRPIGPTLAGLNAFQPTILMGYPGTLAILAEKQLEGRLQIAPIQVQSSAEEVPTAARDLVESAFGVPFLNVYSSTEHLIMGLSRPEYGGMYLFEDNLIYEIGADHTLVTNLFNYTMPFIRYRMSDVLTPRSDLPGGLPFTKIEDLLGRNENIPRFINEQGEEDFLHPSMIAEFFVKNVCRYQLKLVDQTHCIFRFCLAGGLSETERVQTIGEVRQQLRAILAQKEMRNVDCRFEVVDDLPVDPKTGKFRLIVPPDIDPVPGPGKKGSAQVGLR